MAGEGDFFAIEPMETGKNRRPSEAEELSDLVWNIRIIKDVTGGLLDPRRCPRSEPTQKIRSTVSLMISTHAA